MTGAFSRVEREGENASSKKFPQFPHKSRDRLVGLPVC